MNSLLILFGESFRLGGQGNHNRGNNQSYKEQINASLSHIKFIESLKKKNINITVSINSYTTKFNNSLNEIYKSVLVDSKYSCLLIINNIDNIKSVEFLSGIASERAKDSLSKMDEKDFGIGAQILYQLNIQKLALLSNSHQIKRVGLAGYGLEIVEYVGY